MPTIQFPQKDKLAVIGSNYLDPTLVRPFLEFDSQEARSWQEVKTTITSGSLVSLPAFGTIGPFREELFIDGIDFDYCLRARSLGFEIIITCKPLMQHGIGAATRHRLPWKTTGTSNHLAIRRYYMSRNQLVLVREYFWKEPAWATLTLYRRLKDLILLCFFREGRPAQIGARSSRRIGRDNYEL